MPRELALIAGLVVNCVPTEVIMGHSITCDAVFLSQNLRLTSLGDLFVAAFLVEVLIILIGRGDV